VERAENIARILRSMVPRVRRAEPAELGSIIRLHACLGLRRSKLSRINRKPRTYPALEKELFSMLTNSKRTSSLPCALEEVSRIGGNVRERLSADMMLIIGQLRNAMRVPGHDPKEKIATELDDYPAKLTACLELLSAFSGMERENINRGSGWLFMSIGRRLERAIYLTRQLRVITRPLPAQDAPFLECLLEVADSSMTYRTRYYTTIQPLAVLDVLMADESNPRSLDFQLEHLVELYEKLPRHADADLQAMRDALASLRRIDLQAIKYPPSGKAARHHPLTAVDDCLGELEKLLPSWSNNLSSQYFNHARTLPITMGQ
jgi:uncharacterized alpha-E superfamily protein